MKLKSKAESQKNDDIRFILRLVNYLWLKPELKAGNQFYTQWQLFFVNFSIRDLSIADYGLIDIKYFLGVVANFFLKAEMKWLDVL